MKAAKPGSIESITTNLPEANTSVVIIRRRATRASSSRGLLDRHKEEFEGKICRYRAG